MSKLEEANDGGEAISSTTLQLTAEKTSATWCLEGGAACCPPVRAVGEGETIVIGAGPEADVRVFDRAVSARHCTVEVRGGEAWLRDLSSRNGVFAGGARVEAAQLVPGGSFVIGRAVLSCRPGLVAAPPAEGELVPMPGVVGVSTAIARVVREARRLAGVKGPVLLRGETGTGKDVLARAIHEAGPRRNGPFVPLNVGTLPRELADSELFGHERGAFTGAHGAREGAFALADGGTLFLDEVAELTPDLQVKLLRILEDGEVRPVGGRARRKVDVRVISATWAPLHRRVAEGLFRQDLYQRLAVFPLDLPPLRERRTDLPLLAAHFLRDLAPEVGAHELGPGALAKLAAYGWPGNVRELRSVLYRAAVSSNTRLIGSHEIAQSLEIAVAPAAVSVSSEQAWAVVASHGGNVSAAARHLGVARSTFRDLLGR